MFKALMSSQNPIASISHLQLR